MKAYTKMIYFWALTLLKKHTFEEAFMIDKSKVFEGQKKERNLLKQSNQQNYLEIIINLIKRIKFKKDRFLILTDISKFLRAV